MQLKHEELCLHLEDMRSTSSNLIKPVSHRICIRNQTMNDIVFNTVLSDGTVECEGCVCPPGGYIVIQPGGELNYFSESKLYSTYRIRYSKSVGESKELLERLLSLLRPDGIGIDRERCDDWLYLDGLLVEYVEEILTRVDVDDKFIRWLFAYPAACGNSGALSIVESIQRTDMAWKLPTDSDGSVIDYTIDKPWGPNGSIVYQSAQSGDFLIRSGLSRDFYFNCRDGGTMSQYEVDLEGIRELPLEAMTEHGCNKK